MENQQSPEGRAHARRTFTKAQQAEHVAAWKRSGQSARTYGQAHGLADTRLYAWSSKSRSAKSPRRLSKGSPFMPVRVSGLTSVSGSITITVRSRDLEFVVSGATGTAEIVSVIKSLKREVLDV